MRFSPADTLFAYYYGKGVSHEAYQSMGAHLTNREGQDGVYFALWAPFAQSVSVVGDFNAWDPTAHPMFRLGTSSLWECFVPGLGEGCLYKYAVTGEDSVLRFKADPMGFSAELRPHTASIIQDLGSYRWQDDDWMQSRPHARDLAQAPMNIYEVHLTSWLESCTDSSGIHTAKVGRKLAQYCKRMHYTHVELMPVMEHPLDDSWGYQVTGFYATSGRLGTPQDLMALVDACHKEGIGVILDWVPGHFCKDEPGLLDFDGTELYGWDSHPHWGTQKFNFSYKHVWSFLISNALFWLREFHADGLRVDGLASMLYLTYGREQENRRNAEGGIYDLDAIDFLKELNATVAAEEPCAIMIAEDSSPYPYVTQPVESEGLGFTLKWNMGWMNDSLSYFSRDPLFRQYHHNELTFSMMYAFSEHYILSLSHDEVVHGKCSLIDKMPGEYEQKFAGLRTLMAWQMFHPGKKLIFMGGEFAQFVEWRFAEPLEWFLLNYPTHKLHQAFVRELNQFYLEQPEFWAADDSWEGFKWLDADNNSWSILSFVRSDGQGSSLVVVLNLTPVDREGFVLGVDRPGKYAEVFTTDLTRYGGEGRRNRKLMPSQPIPANGQPHQIRFDLPGFTAIVLKNKHPEPDPKPVVEVVDALAADLALGDAPMPAE